MKPIIYLFFWQEVGEGMVLRFYHMDPKADVYYSIFLIFVIQLQLSPFPPIALPYPAHPLHSSPPPVILVHRSFIHVP